MYTMITIAGVTWIITLVIQVIILNKRSKSQYQNVQTVIPVENHTNYQQVKQRTSDVLPTSEVVEEPYPFSDKDKARLLAGLPSDDDDIVCLSDDDYAYMLYMEEQYEIQQMNTEFSQQF